MFRASSEVAVTIIVTSPGEKPSSSPSSRPCWRAVTMSTSERTSTVTSIAGGPWSRLDPSSLLPNANLFQVGQAHLQIERGHHALQGRAELGGTPGDPALSGQLTLRDGAVTLPALGVRYTGARARIALNGSRMVLDSTRLHTDDGSMSAAGEISFEDLREPTYDIEVAADQFEVVRTSSVRATVSGDVRVQGVGAAPEVSGLIEVERADLYLGDLASGSSVAPASIAPVSRPPGALVGNASPDPGLSWRLASAAALAGARGDSTTIPAETPISSGIAVSAGKLISAPGCSSAARSSSCRSRRTAISAAGSRSPGSSSS